MWRVKIVLLCYVLCCVSRAADPIYVFGYEGRNVTISCRYDEGYETYEKYLCKSSCGKSDVLSTTNGNSKTRYYITEDKSRRKFSVTISNLRFEDDGIYWCGVTRTGKDIYTKVKLKIKPDFCCDDQKTILSFAETSVSIPCLIKSENQNNLKFLCRGNRSSTCLQRAVITSHSSYDKRFTLSNDKSSTFTVKINNLTQEDSGLYLCGIQTSTGLDVFSAVNLQVKEWCCVQSVNMSGIVGHPVTLQCFYPSQHQENKKFICKGDKHSTCTDMTNHSRFILHNVSSTSFLVTITDLEASDAGMYWCGSDLQWSVGNYTKINLFVGFQQLPTTTEKVTPSSSTKEDNVLFYTLLVILALPFILTFGLLFIFKECFKNPQAAVQISRANEETEMRINNYEMEDSTYINFLASAQTHDEIS